MEKDLHGSMTTPQPNPPSPQHREEIYAVFADRTKAFDETIEQALEIAAEALSVDVGFTTRIQGGTRRVTHATCSETRIEPGVVSPVEESYCRQTLQQERPFVVEDWHRSEGITAAVYERFGLGCYIGMKLTVDNRSYGTLCFAGNDPREIAFTDAEIIFVELLARLVTQALERRAYDRKLDARTARLRDQKERFEDIAETNFDVIFRVDPQAQITYASSAATRIVGYQPDELVGKPFPEFVEGSSIEHALEAFQQTLEGSAVENIKLEFLKGDDSRAILEVNARPVVKDGEIIEVQGVARDITHHVEQERRLKLQNRAINDSQLGISISEIDGETESIVFANQAFEVLTGYDETEVIGETHQILIGEQTDTEAIAELSRKIPNGDSSTVELVSYRKDGTPYWARASISPVLNDDDDITHVIQFHQDITERERTRRLVDLFNRIHRHNLRNELNVIMGYSQLIGDTDIERQPQEIANAGATIHRTAASLYASTGRIRELERYTHQERQPTRIDPGAMLSRVVEPFCKTYPDSTIELTVATERDICAGSELERAISELVNNALTHNEASTHINVGVAEVGDQLEITVVDDGAGISAQEAGFISTGRETALQHGSGVGLWFVNWIVTRYGGSFQIEPACDDEPHGTVATVTIQSVGSDERVQEHVQPPSPLFR